MANDATKWRAESDAATSLKGNVDDAVLVLRLGIAITAMRASHRLTLCVRGSDEPGARRDRLWAFLLAAAYLHELRVTLQHRFPRVKELALAGGSTEQQAKEVGEAISGQSDFSRAIVRVRNGLVFHFDEDAVRQWIAGYKGDSVLWAEGIGPPTGNVLYRASTDVVSSAILPDVDLDTEAGREEFTKFVEEVLRVTELVTEFFERAIAGYLESVGAQIHEEGSA